MRVLPQRHGLRELESRATGVLETPLSGWSTDAAGACDPKELVSAQAFDTELAVVYGWRRNS